MKNLAETAIASAASVGASLRSLACACREMGQVMRYFTKAADRSARENRDLSKITGITRDEFSKYAARGWTARALIYYYLEVGKLPTLYDG